MFVREKHGSGQHHAHLHMIFGGAHLAGAWASCITHLLEIHPTRQCLRSCVIPLLDDVVCPVGSVCWQLVGCLVTHVASREGAGFSRLLCAGQAVELVCMLVALNACTKLRLFPVELS